MTYKIVRYHRDTCVIVGKGYRTLEAAQAAQARFYAARNADDDADFLIE